MPNSIIFVVRRIRSALSIFLYFFELIDTFIKFRKYSFQISPLRLSTLKELTYILFRDQRVSLLLLQFTNLFLGKGHQFLHKQSIFVYMYPINWIF